MNGYGFDEIEWKPYYPIGDHKRVYEQNKISYFVVEHISNECEDKDIELERMLLLIVPLFQSHEKIL